MAIGSADVESRSVDVRVALNVANSYWRRLAAERKAKSRLEGHAHHLEPDPAEAIAVRQALARLPKKQRSVLVLRFYVDLSVRDVAANPQAIPSTQEIRQDLTKHVAASLCRHEVAWGRAETIKFAPLPHSACCC